MRYKGSPSKNVSISTSVWNSDPLKTIKALFVARRTGAPLVPLPQGGPIYLVSLGDSLVTVFTSLCNKLLLKYIQSVIKLSLIKKLLTFFRKKDSFEISVSIYVMNFSEKKNEIKRTFLGKKFSVRMLVFNYKL